MTKKKLQLEVLTPIKIVAFLILSLLWSSSDTVIKALEFDAANLGSKPTVTHVSHRLTEQIWVLSSLSPMSVIEAANLSSKLTVTHVSHRLTEQIWVLSSLSPMSVIDAANLRSKPTVTHVGH